MKKRFLTSLFIISIFLLCFGTSRAEEPLNIMVVYGQLTTKVTKFVSAEDLKGATIAVEKLNAEGGLLGRKINIVDTRVVDNLQINSDIQRLLKENDILAVIGANTSTISLVIAPYVQKAGIPMISPIATNPAVTEVGDYVFRACFTDPFQGRIMARFALDDLKAKNAALLVKIDSKFSTSLTGYFREEFEKTGKIVYEGHYLAEDADFGEILANVKKLSPDVVFVPGHGKDCGLLLKQALMMGIKTVFLGGDGWGKGLLGVAGPEPVEGNYFSNHWHMDLQKPASLEFVKKYREKYGENLIAASAPLAYDSVMLLADAVGRAQSTDHKKVRDALAATKNFQGITGLITFNENGDPINKDAVIMKYENGQIKYVKSITP